MTTQRMSEVEKSPTSKSQWNFDASSITSILLADGWHNVKNCQKGEFSVTSSPATDGPYTVLQYTSEGGEQIYTPFKNILAYKFSGQPTSGSSNF